MVVKLSHRYLILDAYGGWFSTFYSIPYAGLNHYIKFVTVALLGLHELGPNTQASYRKNPQVPKVLLYEISSSH